MASDKQELRTDEWELEREVEGRRCVPGVGMPMSIYGEVSLMEFCFPIILPLFPKTLGLTG